MGSASPSHSVIVPEFGPEKRPAADLGETTRREVRWRSRRSTDRRHGEEAAGRGAGRHPPDRLRAAHMSHRSSAAQTSDQSLVSSRPLELLLARWAEELEIRRRRVGSAAPPAEFEMMRSMHAEAEEALRDARREDVYVSVVEAAEKTGIPESSVRRHCAEHAAVAGASKVNGVKGWRIHLPTYLAFLGAHPETGTTAREQRALPHTRIRRAVTIAHMEEAA